MTYRATAATVGNSRALRVDSALFRAHPEFAAGEFDVSVIAPGRMLVQSTSDTPPDDTDPVFDAFLGFVEHQMALRPDLITKVTKQDRRDADQLVRGVKPAPDEDLGDDFVLPDTRVTSRGRKPRRKALKK
jgi:antitoxin PrlF